MRSLSLACAMSRATIIGPVSSTRVVTGSCESAARISSIGRVRSMATELSSLKERSDSGMKRPGFVSIFSRKTPSGVILALMLRSALQETPMPTGQLAPWRGRRTMRTSSAKYLPPNWAPTFDCCASLSTFASISRSRKARPSSLPVVGSVSRYLVVASFTVFMQASALVPPMTNTR